MLKYLFTATFSDDTSIQQTPEDVSLVDPKRSAFYDVLQRIAAGDKLIGFSLTDGTHTASLDLITGQFTINGLPFGCYPDKMPTPEADYRLIYYRRHQQHFTLNYQEVGHDIQFVFGWQTTIAGKNYQQTIEVA